MRISTTSGVSPFPIKWKKKRWVLHCIIALLLLSGVQDALSFSPDCPIINGGFQGLANGTTSATGWSIDASNVSSTGYFAVKSNRLHAQELGGVGIWRSSVFSVAGYSDFQVAVKVHSEGDLNSSEYVKIYYRVNGGSEVLMDQRTGNFGTLDFISPSLTGNNVQIIVRIYNYNNGGSQTSKYYIEEYRVFKEDGPCGSSIQVSASANNAVLTCTNPSATLSASSSASGVTYSWTGPNNFSSTSQNPVISTAGTYTVTGSSAAGSGSASVTVTENKTPPDVTATGGTLACGSSVTLNASSSVSGVTYRWTGPDNFTSTSRNPVVSTAGTYTVTVTNPANGCTASQSVTVTSGAATASAFWMEDFSALANGSARDEGTTRWESSTSGSGTFSVQNNEFMASFSSGNTAEGVWTSGVVDISSKQNIVASVDLRSATATTSDALENTDYIKVYYKLDGGAETAIFSDVAGLNGTTAGSASATATSPTLNGSTLQIVIRVKNSDPTERYYFDNVKLTGTASAAVTISTSVNGVVTCTSTAQIIATPSGTVSSYSWTGPNGFTSTAQNPVVSAGGQYILTATLPGGCTVQQPVTVTENKTAPDLTATGGSLSCATSFTLNATSSVAGATYSWTGPNSFASTSKNPVVTAAGTYTVTVTNPANGCTASQSVQVTAAMASAFWTEDFASLANGTTSDNGATSWTASTSGSGTFSVQNNEFMAAFNAGNAAEGVWTSGVIDISAVSNAVVSVDLKSATAGSSDAFETSDYIKVFYKLNGGAETSIYSDVAGLNGTTSGTASATVTSEALSGSTLQVVIRLKNTDPTERYYFDNIKVTGVNQGSVNASATVSGTLSCAQPSVTLQGSSTTAGVTYRWTGPNGFTSATQSSAVSVPGTYTLLVSTNAGCSAVAVVEVGGSTENPNVTAAVSGPLSCSVSSVTLSGSSTTPGVNYRWTGPGNFTSTVQNPAVSVAGTYTLTVTNPVNGCSSTQTVQVTQAVNTAEWHETFALANGTTVDTGTTSWSTQSSTGTFAVSGNEFVVTNTGTTDGVHGVWTSGLIDISGQTNVGISVGVRSAVTGDAVMNESGEYADYIRIYYKLDNGSKVLVGERLGGINNHSTTPTIISAGSLSGTSLQIVIKGKATASDEFYYFDNVKVTGTVPGTIDATAAVSGPLTCTTTSVTLLGNTSASGVTYSWTGPDNFTSTVQNPVVNKPGTYILTVRSGSGCTGTATVTVNQNITPPGATASVSGSLSCSASSVTLTGSSPTSGVTYSWTGPGNFTSTAQNPAVSVAGTYTLTVTNPVNGCSSTQSVQVAQGGNATEWHETFTLPNGTTSDAGTTSWSTQSSTGTFAVSGNEFVVTNIGTTAGVQGVWTSGAIDIAGQTNVGVSVGVRSAITGSAVMNGSGEYADYIRIYYKLNNGPEVLVGERLGAINNHSTTPTTISIGSLSGTSLQIVIKGKATGVDEFYYFDNVKVTGTGQSTIDATAAVSGPLTCATTSVTLSGSSNVSGVAYRWTGPDNFTSAAQNPVVNKPGTYILTVSKDGCSGSATVTVTQDNAVPAVTATASGAITCTTASVTLTATSANGVTYSWSGPGTITNPASAIATVSIAGTYTVTVKNLANGCVATASVTVVQNSAVPQVTAGAAGMFTCASERVVLTATPSISGVTYSWRGPNGFTSTAQNPEVTLSGTYTVTVKDQVNGCVSAAASITTQENRTPPGATASVSGGITCDNQIVVLNAASETAGVRYRWVGPNGYTSSEKSPQSTLPGTYTVTVTNPVNGCTSSSVIDVVENKTAPEDVAASVSARLTCSEGSVTLRGTSSTTGVRYQWTGPNGFTSAAQNPSVQSAGIYLLRATNPANGCTATASVEVEEDTAVPADVTASVTEKLTCTRKAVTLNGGSTTASVTYRWTGPDNFTSLSATTSVTVAGIYELTVSNTSNGCQTKVSVTVLEDTTVPASVTAIGGTITCASPNVTLNASSETSNVSYRWTSQNGFSSNEKSPVVNVPGTYTVVVTHPETGCTQTASATVGQGDTSIPGGVSISASGNLTCTENKVELTASSGAAGVTYRWTGPGTIADPTSATIEVLAGGVYSVTATVAGSGCTATASKEVIEDKGSPENVTATAGVITCSESSAVLTASSSTSAVSYQWSGPGTIANPASATTFASATGLYSVTVTNPLNGCTSSASATVTQNKTAPQAGTISASSGFILTCYTNTTTLSCSSTTGGATYKWTNSSGTVLSETTSVTVSVPDTYTFTVTNPVNGCVTSRSRAVSQNRVSPTASITPGGDITCADPAVTLTGTSSGSPVTFSWAGPGPVTPITTGATTATVSVSVAGIYTLTLTTPAGCTGTANVTVNGTPVLPDIDAYASGELNCEQTRVSLFGDSTTPDAIFGWTGPGGFESDEQNPRTTVPGNYTLTVTDPATGCIARKTVTVEGEECVE